MTYDEIDLELNSSEMECEMMAERIVRELEEEIKFKEA